jgi:hypothetical protein
LGKTFFIFKEIYAMAKKLLNEAVVRRFQSLANIKPINEMQSIEEEKVEETVEAVEETIEEGEENLEEGVYEADEEPEVDAEAPEMEMDAEEPAALEDVELTDEEAEALIALGEKLAAAMGEAAEEEMPMDDAPEAPEMPDLGGEEEMPMEEALEGINYVPSQTEIVNEVARRVARRLAEAQKAEKKMNEALGRK